MRIMITGASGFIGKNLKERLSQKHQVFAPSSRELNLIEADAVSSFLKKHHFDVVLHCATWDAKWNSTKDRTMVLDHNLRMFFNLVRKRESFDKLICFGSGAEFARCHSIPFMTEDYFDTHVPNDQYGFSKYVINKYIDHMENTVNLRLFGVYGKYEDWNTRFISNAICRAIYDLPITIYQDVAFDYLYIEDLLNIVEWFLHNTPNEKTYNVCTGTTNLLTTLSTIVLDTLQKRLPIVLTRTEVGQEYSANNSRLLSEIIGLQFTPITQAIKDLCLWYSAHIDQIPYQVLYENARFVSLLQEA